jgi:hypothetical protein
VCAQDLGGSGDGLSCTELVCGQRQGADGRDHALSSLRLRQCPFVEIYLESRLPPGEARLIILPAHAQHDPGQLGGTSFWRRTM